MKEQNQMTQDISSLIATLEDERYAAMLSSDMVKLDRLLDDRLRYVHSNGRKDDKFSYMKGFGLKRRTVCQPKMWSKTSRVRRRYVQHEMLWRWHAAVGNDTLVQ